jgi:hypothetical protein
MKIGIPVLPEHGWKPEHDGKGWGDRHHGGKHKDDDDDKPAGYKPDKDDDRNHSGKDKGQHKDRDDDDDKPAGHKPDRDKHDDRDHSGKDKGQHKDRDDDDDKQAGHKPDRDKHDDRDHSGKDKGQHKDRDDDDDKQAGHKPDRDKDDDREHGGKDKDKGPDHGGKPDHPEKVVVDECGNQCYTADPGMNDKFVFGDKSGGDDTIKCFDGKGGDLIDICGSYEIDKNDCGDVVICWGHGDTVTLAGVQYVEDCWIV